MPRHTSCWLEWVAYKGAEAHYTWVGMQHCSLVTGDSGDPRFYSDNFKWFHASLFAIPLKQDRLWQPQWLVNVAADEKDNRVWRNAEQLALLAVQEQEPSASVL